jgi:hypothetical protein
MNEVDYFLPCELGIHRFACQGKLYPTGHGQSSGCGLPQGRWKADQNLHGQG